MSSTVEMFHSLSHRYSRDVTKKYSSSFSLAIRLLGPHIRQDIYNIYGFVRLADEIVDTFHDYPKRDMLEQFETDVYRAIEYGISIHPALDSFQHTAKKYNIGRDLIDAFLTSMKRDLEKKDYTVSEYHEYIYGSADVVGLMCLKVFVNGDEKTFDSLRESAMRLGSAFQKVNFLRDVKDDYELLNRSYFPGINPDKISNADKEKIIEEVRGDFREAFKGIIRLPSSSRFGVYIAYRYYLKLMKKLELSAPDELMKRRIGIPDIKKLLLIVTGYFRYRLSLHETSH